MLHFIWPGKATSLALINPKKLKVNTGKPLKEDSENKCTHESKFNSLMRMKSQRLKSFPIILWTCGGMSPILNLPASPVC